MTEPDPASAERRTRLLVIAGLAVIVAVATSLVARFLITLIDFFTNIAFHGNFSLTPASPAANTLGISVVLIPVAGGLIVGLMAVWGSKAIRGHGIPEAMEQILTNQSKIKPAITVLKPLSAAISIGTGGPFGAEGPIISTGGALGSTLGQLLTITNHERKILLAAGATSGMAAIFGSPLAAVFLAIELLLFEFSPRSIIPIALACITGAAGHHFLFAPGPVFPVATAIEMPGNEALAFYSAIGIVIGFLSVVITKTIYLVEDGFEKLPIPWPWWPAIGGVVVGIVGYFAPRTMGVGYDNIIEILSGTLPLRIIFFLCLLKFISWVIALGSGTSGGTLAPLLTIGGAAGSLLASAILYFFPTSGVTLPLAAITGMTAMFAGASRALLTSIVFGFETTLQPNALLPLLAACSGSYFVSFFIMKNTIMTEKIARRGVKAPHSYESDVLERVTVGQAMKKNPLVLPDTTSLRKASDQLRGYPDLPDIVVTSGDHVLGVVESSVVTGDAGLTLADLVPPDCPTIRAEQSLREATQQMAADKRYILAVYRADHELCGTLSYRDIVRILGGVEGMQRNISLKRSTLRLIVRGQHLMKRRHV